MIRQLLAGLVGALVVGVGLGLVASASAGPGAWTTPAELFAAFVLLVAGGVAMAWAVAP